MRSAGWGWYAALFAASVFIALRLVVLSKQVKHAGAGYKRAARSRAAAEGGDPRAAQVYAVKVLAGDMLSEAVPVAPMGGGEGENPVVMAVALPMEDDETSRALQGALRDGAASHVVINGLCFRARHQGWGRRTNPDRERTHSHVWLLEPDPGVDQPLGEPGTVDRGLALRADGDGVALCYVLAF